MVSIKLLIFADLREKFDEQTESQLELNHTHWESAAGLRSFILEQLTVNWFKRRQANSVYVHGAANEEINDSPSVPIVDPDSIMLAINEDFVSPNQVINLSQGDVVALIPPISGG